MADIKGSKTVRSGAVQTLTRITLSASDTFVFVPNTGMILELHNNTAGALTPNIKGSAPSAAFPIPGAGDTTISLTAGLTVNLGVNQSAIINLDAVEAYLEGTGTVTITGGTGITAVLLSN
jgi:hypothetical protein